MIKKVIWTVVFVSMGLAGSLAGFGIGDIFTSISTWWSNSLSPLWTTEPKPEAAEWFAFIGGTIWTMIIVAPLWYLWKGVGIFSPKGFWGIFIRAVLIVLLYITPSIVGIVVASVDSLSADDQWFEYFNMIFTWVIIALALLGLWIKS